MIAGATINRGTSATTEAVVEVLVVAGAFRASRNAHPHRICPSGAREVLAPSPGRISFSGVRPVVTLVPRLMVAPATTLRVRLRRILSLRSSHHRLISPQPSGLGILIFNLLHKTSLAGSKGGKRT